MPNKIVAKIVNKLKVACTSRYYGCKWEGGKEQRKKRITEWQTNNEQTNKHINNNNKQSHKQTKQTNEQTINQSIAHP